MAFVKKMEGILKNHSAHKIQSKPVHTRCLGLVDVWQPAQSSCSALAAKHLEVSRKILGKKMTSKSSHLPQDVVGLALWAIIGLEKGIYLGQGSMVG